MLQPDDSIISNCPFQCLLKNRLPNVGINIEVRISNLEKIQNYEYSILKKQPFGIGNCFFNIFLFEFGCSFFSRFEILYSKLLPNNLLNLIQLIQRFHWCVRGLRLRSVPCLCISFRTFVSRSINFIMALIHAFSKLV